MAVKATSLTSIPAAIVRYVKEARQELRKVTWPSRQVTVRYTLIVVIASLVVGVVVGGLDYILTIILEQYVL